ncbi:MAG: NADH-quinone oxidoreductase subunit J [Acidimicrobiia bacterium]|nr:NADH-quinone oxidoreductase subunit J [Acidimicrobiia bacterium]
MIETVFFVIFAAASITGAITMVWSRNPVHSAMGLMLTMFSLAVFYVLNLGHVIAAVQVIVYAGAVMTLFLFVIMLIGVDRAEDRSEQLPFQRQAAVILAAGFAVAVLLAGGTAWWTDEGPEEIVNGTIEAVSEEFFDRWLLPFEVTALLLIIAAAGTIALAQFAPRRRDEAQPGREVDDTGSDATLSESVSEPVENP